MERTKEYNPFFSLCCVIPASLCQRRTGLQDPQEPELLLSPLHGPSAGTCSFFRSYGYSPDLSVVLLIDTGMNFVSSHRNHENRSYEGSPPQGPSRGTAAQFVCFSDICRWSAAGAPRRGRRHISKWGVWGSQSPIILSRKNSIFQRNPSYNS